jgi:hypothetical protein
LEIKVYPISGTEDLEDLIRLLRQATADRIILFAEGESPSLRDASNLRMLRYYAQERGFELFVITHDPIARREAERLGLYRWDMQDPLGENDDAYQMGLEFAAPAEEKPVVPPVAAGRRPFASRLVNGRLISALIVAGITLFFALSLLFAPQVTLIAYPVMENQRFTTEAKLSPGYSEKEISKGRLPGKAFVHAGTIRFATAVSGRKRVGFRPAVGKVTVVNGMARSMVLPKGTRVLGKSGTVYVTREDVLVPPKSRQTVSGLVTGEVYGQVDVEIEAVEKGTVGNTPANSITKFDSKLAKGLQVTNFRAITGGEDRQVPVVTQADLERCRTELLRQMELAATDEIRAMVGEGYVFLPELVWVTPGELILHGQVGEEMEQVDGELHYTAKTVAVAKKVLLEYMKAQFQKELPPYLEPVGDKVLLSAVTARPGKDNRHSLELQGSIKVRGRLDKKRLLQSILGKDVASARIMLASFPELGRYELRMPKSMKTLPGWEPKIRVILREQP